MRSPQIPVTREGYPFIFVFAFVTLVFALLGYTLVTFLGLAATIFVLCFFRDPERFIPAKEHALVSPADGKIIILEKVQDDEFLHQEAYKISIFMNVFNVHVNRLPFSGTVRKIIYKPGKFHSADSEKSALYNENCATILEGDSGVRVAFVQVAGLIARRIINWLELGEKVVKGDRFGLIRFGSRVDIYVPADTVIAIRKGQRVRAGETVIGYLNL